MNRDDIDPDSPALKMFAFITNNPTGQQVVKKAKNKVKDKKAKKGSPGPVTKARIRMQFESEFDNLWKDSKPYVMNLSPQAERQTFLRTTKNERGCWIISDSKGNLRIQIFTTPGDRDGCVPDVPTGNPNERVVAFYHTHPNSGQEGYDRGPSPEDLTAATNWNIPGLIRSQIGGYAWFGPNTIPDG